MKESTGNRLCYALMSHKKSEKGITSQKCHWRRHGTLVNSLGPIHGESLEMTCFTLFLPYGHRAVNCFSSSQSLFWVLGEALGSVLCNHPLCWNGCCWSGSSRKPTGKPLQGNMQCPDAHHEKTEA